MNYIIYSPGFRENSGGIVVLHTLGKKLQDRGCNVFMLSTNSIDELRTIDINDAYQMREDSWIIYPEIVEGNPLQFTNVIRWVLNTPGYIGGNSNTWKDTDLVFLLWDYFKVDTGIEISGYLRAWDFRLDYFYDYNKPRHIDTWIARKAANRLGSPKDVTFDKHPQNAICIDGEITNNFTQLRDTLNQSNLFVSYDEITYHSIIAVLCGAISVVIPPTGATREEWVRQAPIFKYGVAYGLDDIEWAKSTSHLVRDYLLEFETESNDLIGKFLEITNLTK